MKGALECMYDPNRLLPPRGKARIWRRMKACLLFSWREHSARRPYPAGPHSYSGRADISERLSSAPWTMFVFRSRGERNTAAVMDESNFTGASACNLAVNESSGLIRQLLSGAYLAWAINQEPAQRHFQEAAQRHKPSHVSRTALETCKVSVVPDLKRRKNLAVDALKTERERAGCRGNLPLKHYDLITPSSCRTPPNGPHAKKGMERMPK